MNVHRVIPTKWRSCRHRRLCDVTVTLCIDDDHCSFKAVAEKTAVVGLHSQSSDDEYTQRVDVAEIFVNAKYNRPGRPMTSDLMLLKLARPVHLSAGVTPVCLPRPFQMFSSGQLCFGTGWGNLECTYIHDAASQRTNYILASLTNNLCFDTVGGASGRASDL